MLKDISIPVFIINLKEHSDRLKHVLNQFEGKKEFDIHIVERCNHKSGDMGLWQSIVKIIKEVYNSDDDLIIICEDDHTFTEHYNRDTLIRNIIEAVNQNVELLSGGISGFGNAVPITSERYWIDWLRSLQFTVLYRPVFKKILNYNFKENDTACEVLSMLTSHKMVLYPFISIQRDFGYSDIALSNGELKDKVTELFKQANKKMEIYQYVNLKYLQKQTDIEKL